MFVQACCVTGDPSMTELDHPVVTGHVCPYCQRVGTNDIAGAGLCAAGADDQASLVTFLCHRCGAVVFLDLDVREPVCPHAFEVPEADIDTRLVSAIRTRYLARHSFKTLTWCKFPARKIRCWRPAAGRCEPVFWEGVGGPGEHVPASEDDDCAGPDGTDTDGSDDDQEEAQEALSWQRSAIVGCDSYSLSHPAQPYPACVAATGTCDEARGCWDPPGLLPDKLGSYEIHVFLEPRKGQTLLEACVFHGDESYGVHRWQRALTRRLGLRMREDTDTDVDSGSDLDT